MKTVKILFPLLILAVLSLAVSPVLAAKGIMYEYAVVGGINNEDLGIGAEMLLTLKGQLRLGNPDYYNEEVVMDQPGERHDWQDWHYMEWSEGETNYRGDITWSLDDSWMEDFTRTTERWYTLKSQWSGELIAASPPFPYETFELRLTPNMAERHMDVGVREGHFVYHEERQNVEYQNETTSGDWWWIGDQTIDQEADYVMEYSSETLSIYFSGKMRIDGKMRLRGNLSLHINTNMQHAWWDDEEMHQEGTGVNGGGRFGPYRFGFGHQDDG